ncbi:hypothetical protein L489_5563, partial [Bordetella bronchiseptica 00-P-2730]
TLKNVILKEAVEYAATKKWIARSPLLSIMAGNGGEYVQ